MGISNHSYESPKVIMIGLSSRYSTYRDIPYKNTITNLMFIKNKNRTYSSILIFVL